MAQFAAQGRLKLLFYGEGDHYRPVGNAFVSGLRSFQLQKRKIKLFGSTRAGLYATSWRRKSRQFHAKASDHSGSEESVSSDDTDQDYDSEFEDDDLSSFRGLVLDISYRPINVVCWRRAICLEFMEKADVLEYYDQTVNSPSGSFYIPAVLRVPHLLQVVKRRRIKSTLSRKNVFHRDNYTCQYCSARKNLTIDHIMPIARGGEWKWENLESNEMFSMIVPDVEMISTSNPYDYLPCTRLGKVIAKRHKNDPEIGILQLLYQRRKVTACAKCNTKKGQKNVEEANMTLLKPPKAPKDYDILATPLTNAALRMLRIRNGTPEEWRQYLASES